MPRIAEEDDWDDDENAEDTAPCPYCGRDILQDTPRCPHCENYLSEEDQPEEAAPTGKPWWLYLGVAVCLYAVLRWIGLAP